MTIPDFLEARFPGRGAVWVWVAAVVIILLFYATYISAQFMAAGKIFETTFTGIDTPWGPVSLSYVQGILIGCGMILFYTVMGGFLAVAVTELIQGLIMVFAVAAVMSTVDSQILVVVSAVVEDIYGKILGGDVRSLRGLWMGRTAGLLLGLAGFWLALERSSVFQQVFNAWGGLAAGLGPAVCFSLLWRRTTWQGVLGGMVTGAGLIQFWPLIEKGLPVTPVTVWGGGLIPGFVLASLTVWWVSLLSQNR